MYKIITHRRWYYRFSALVILPGLIAMIYSLFTIGAPFHLSIDFVGGTLWEMRFEQAVAPGDVVEVFADYGIADASASTIGDDRTFVVRSSEISPEQKQTIEAALITDFGPLEDLQFRAVGPIISQEVTRTAFIATVLATLVILGFITWAFRQVQNPFRFGAAAVVAMLHDVFITLGFFSIMGLIAGWEVDALFLTALLTVIGFSVQDTIVVFDRIRENSRRRRGEDFEVIANRSLLETMQRSIATQINAMFVMIALLLFGGVTIQHFIATLLVGMLSGTYSSIFIATPLLVSWANNEFPWFSRSEKKSSKAVAA
jgi:preprotein translocase SecF subunit